MVTVLGLCCLTRAFSSYGERGLLSGCGEQASHSAASLGAEHGLLVCRLSSFAAHELMWNLSGPRTESMSLHWPVDSFFF